MQVRKKEVYNPPRTYEYNDARMQPHYLKPTANMRARKAAALPPGTAERVHAAYLKERTWPHLEPEQVAQCMAASEDRRRVQDLRMPAAQAELEHKCVRSGLHAQAEWALVNGLVKLHATS